MTKKKFGTIVAVPLLACVAMAGYASAGYLSPLEELGKRVFFDNISVPKRMSCSTCHDPAAGWTLKLSGVNLHQVAVTGADPHTAGSVKPPSNAYASFIKPLFSGCPNGLPGICGGNFWDGRSEGNAVALFPQGATEHIGDEVFSNATGTLNEALKGAYGKYLGPVADQALNPFPNPVEQNIERLGVCRHVEGAKYAELFQIAWEEPIDCSAAGVDRSFKRIAVALAAWQSSIDVNSFSSKRDMALQREIEGKDTDDTPGAFPLVGFTPQENYGHDLFYATFQRPLVVNGVPKFANCVFCHSESPFSDTGAEPFQRYTDDGYHNIGVPANREIPASASDPDRGLAGHTGNPAHTGFFKTPTLRNVDKRPGNGFIKAFTHNGWFKSLESIVHFYNTADVTFAPNGKTRCPDEVTTEKEALKQKCWPAPAHDNTAIPFLVGRLGLTPEDEAAIVAYLKTFSDTSTPMAPEPYKPQKAELPTPKNVKVIRESRSGTR